MKDVLLTHTAAVAAAYLSNNPCDPDRVGSVVSDIYRAFESADQPAETAEPAKPVVSIRASVKPDHIVDLIDGSKHKMLKRHLMTAHGLTPDEYRARFGLPADYPMVAPNYSETRRQLAKAIGLGRHPQAARGRKPATGQRRAAAH